MFEISEALDLLLVASKRFRPSVAIQRLGYIGAHNGRNLGDDLLREAGMKLLGDRFQLTDYELSWHERRLARVGLSGKRYFDGCMLGGGTLISNFWAGKVERALAQGLPMWTLGTGAGACGFVDEDDQDLSRWGSMLKEFQGLGVRGPRSVAKLESLGVTGATVIGDLAFALTPDRLVAASDPPVVALNLSWPGPKDLDRGERAWIERVRDYLPGLVAQGWRVRPFLMNEQDREPTEFVLQQINGPGVESIVRPVNPYELMDLLADCQMAITVRLHAAVLSCCVGVAPLLLAYRDKSLDFMESVGLEQWVLPMTADCIGDFEPLAERLAEESAELRNQIWNRSRNYQTLIKAYAEAIAGAIQNA